MSNITKYALESSLKKMMLTKPLDKITIRDLTEDCGISRMAFYYHFKDIYDLVEWACVDKDIYDLVEWACVEDAAKALEGKKTYRTWQQGLLQIFEAVYENRPFVLNAFRALDREKIEKFLFGLTSDLILGVVEEQAQEKSVTEEEKRFIADFYKYSFVGIMLDWIQKGMKEDYRETVEAVCIILHGTIAHSIDNFTKYRK